MTRKTFCILSFGFTFSTLHYKFSSTPVERSLQIHPFLTNKANFPKAQMTVSDLLTMNYEQRTMNYEIKNKAKTNPIQTQYKANSKPIQSQFKAKQTQFYSPVCLQRPIFPARLLINRINQNCYLFSFSISFDSAKMALYKGNWNLGKDGRKKLNLLSYKSLSGLGRLRSLTGTLFALLYLRIFVLTN